MKSYFIMEKPESCRNCKMNVENNCILINEEINSPFCPLCNLPESKDIDLQPYNYTTNAIEYGYQKCIFQLNNNIPLSRED